MRVLAIVLSCRFLQDNTQDNRYLYSITAPSVATQKPPKEKAAIVLMLFGEVLRLVRLLG
jgi:hypothetical protein